MTDEEYKELKEFYEKKKRSHEGNYSNKERGYLEGLNAFMSKIKEIHNRK